MNRPFAILILSITIFASYSAKSQYKTNSINLDSGFSLIRDTISISVHGKMTHALEFNDKYYVLFEKPLIKYGGYEKRYLYIFSNNQLERVVDLLDEMIKVTYLDFYVQNDNIIFKPYMNRQSYSFDTKNYIWEKIFKTDDLIFEDADYYICSLYFGEWGGKTWFIHKKTGNQYVLECTTPLINKVDNTYYLTKAFEILKIKNPMELTKCSSDVTYENIEKTGLCYSWYSQPKGYEVVYKNEDVNYFDYFTYYPKIVSSFVLNNELLHVYETDTATYLARIVNNKIEPFEKILDDARFFNGHLSYRCKNINGTNKLLTFKTKNDQVFGLTTIKGNKIHVTYFVNNTELKPRLLGTEKSDEIFEHRLESILADFKKLTLTAMESKEKEWGTFDITPNHTIGIWEKWNPNEYDIDLIKAYLVVEDSIISNSIIYFANKNNDLVRAVTIDWEKTNILTPKFDIDKSVNDVFLRRFNELVSILTNKLGKSNPANAETQNPSFSWTIENNINIIIELFSREDYNNIFLVIYEKK